MRKWRIEDSEELYNIKGWGVNYFGINEKGHAFVRPRKDNVEIDLCDIVNDLTERDITAPVLLRFPDILDNRIEKTAACFEQAEKEYDFQLVELFNHQEHTLTHLLSEQRQFDEVLVFVTIAHNHRVRVHVGSKDSMKFGL